MHEEHLNSAHPEILGFGNSGSGALVLVEQQPIQELNVNASLKIKESKPIIKKKKPKKKSFNPLEDPTIQIHNIQSIHDTQGLKTNNTNFGQEKTNRVQSSSAQRGN